MCQFQRNIKKINVSDEYMVNVKKIEKKTAYLATLPKQTVQAKIRLILQGLHCLLFWQSFLESTTW